MENCCGWNQSKFFDHSKIMNFYQYKDPSGSKTLRKNIIKIYLVEFQFSLLWG